MPSPRRSTRALNPPQPEHRSSSSSLSSARPDRAKKSNNKQSPPVHTQTQSASPFTSEDGTVVEPPQTRRSKRSQNAQEDDMVAVMGGQEAGVAVGDDITRCICAQDDYPGPPLTDDSINVSEDAGGLFIQCDGCSVWQHGGCVGIMNEAQTPEQYFCELCEKKLHQLLTDVRGQRYSRYLPLYPGDPDSARKSSLGKDSDAKARKERELVSRASVESTLAKRRSTMNSRQAYDEEETLRRVIEESRGDNEAGPSTTRKAKRSREESADSKQDIKRLRTHSDSPEPASTLHTVSLDAESDDDASRPSASNLKRVRSAAAETQRQRDAREKEKMREAQRIESASRRKDRAGRRRGEDSEPAEETPKPTTSSKESVAPTSQPPTPPATELPPPSSSHKRGGNRKPKRLGKNQYTKDRDVPVKPAISPPQGKSSNQTTTTSSSEEQQPPPAPNGVSHTTAPPKTSPNNIPDAALPVKGRGNRWKGKHAKAAAAEGEGGKEKDKANLTINDMDKGTQFMLEFIGKKQGETPPESRPTSRLDADRGFEAGAVRPVTSNGAGAKTFDRMSSTEMADELTRQILAWRTQFTGRTLAVPAS